MAIWTHGATLKVDHGVVAGPIRGSGETGMRWRHRRYATELSLERCEARLLQLNGEIVELIAASAHGPSHKMVCAVADDGEFALWTISVFYPPRPTRESMFIFRGQWEPDADGGTAIETFYEAGRTLKWTAKALVAPLAALATFHLLWHDAFYYFTGDYPVAITVGLALLPLGLGVSVLHTLLQDELGRLFTENVTSRKIRKQSTRRRPLS
jgi:hypothetical protein